MAETYDVFKINQDGSSEWCGVYGTLDEARAQARQLSKRHLVDFAIVNLETGLRLEVPFRAQKAPVCKPHQDEAP